MLCEGEFDCLLARQHGFPGPITGTAGVGTFKPEWDWAIQGRTVAVAYDAGKFSEAQARARDLLQRGATRAWAVDLAAAGLGDGEDLTDWFVRYGRGAPELRGLINRRGGASWR